MNFAFNIFMKRIKNEYNKANDTINKKNDNEQWMIAVLLCIRGSTVKGKISILGTILIMKKFSWIHIAK